MISPWWWSSEAAERFLQNRERRSRLRLNRRARNGSSFTRTTHELSVATGCCGPENHGSGWVPPLAFIAFTHRCGRTVRSIDPGRRCACGKNDPPAGCRAPSGCNAQPTSGVSECIERDPWSEARSGLRPTSPARFALEPAPVGEEGREGLRAYAPSGLRKT